MNILGEYNYQIENNIKLNDDFYNSLIHLYQPLIGAQAMSLYITFMHLDIHSNYSQLSLYSGLSSECIERSLIMLERYRLIKTYKKDDENEFIHQLILPLLPNEFLNHYVYGLELKKLIGNYQFNLLVKKFQYKVIKKSGYTDISEQKVFNLRNFDEEDLSEILKQNNNNIVLPSQFNFDLLLKDVSELKFPSVLRTKENLNLIAELGLFYGISESRMAILVYRSIDYINKKLLVEDLINRVRREQVSISESSNKYDLVNVAFLQVLLNGAKVSTYQQKLLEELAFDMLLPKAVINRLVEYAMEKNNNKLVRSFILQIASTWKAYDIKTVDEANALIKQIDYQSYQKPKVKEVKRENKIDKDLEFSEIEVEELEAQWKKWGEKYGSDQDK